MMQSAEVEKLLEGQVKKAIGIVVELREERGKEKKKEAFTDRQLEFIEALLGEIQGRLRYSLDWILPTESMDAILGNMRGDYPEPYKVMGIFDCYPIAEIRERCVKALLFSHSRGSYHDSVEWAKRRIPVLLQSKNHCEEGFGKKLLEKMVFETDSDCQGDCLEFALQHYRREGYDISRDAFKILSNALQKNTTLYWKAPSIRFFINRMLAKAERGRYSDWNWTEVQRAIRHIVKQGDVTYLPVIEKILDWHTQGLITYEPVCGEKEVFLPAQNQVFLQSAVDYLEGIKKEQWPDCNILASAINAGAELSGGVDVDINFMNDNGELILQRDSADEMEIVICLRLKAQGEIEKLKTFLQKCFVSWHSEGFEGVKPITPAPREGDIYFRGQDKALFAQSDSNPLTFSAGFKAKSTIGNNRFSLLLDLGSDEEHDDELELTGYVIVGEEKKKA